MLSEDGWAEKGAGECGLWNDIVLGQDINYSGTRWDNQHDE